MIGSCNSRWSGVLVYTFVLFLLLCAQNKMSGLNDDSSDLNAKYGIENDRLAPANQNRLATRLEAVGTDFYDGGEYISERSRTGDFLSQLLCTHRKRRITQRSVKPSGLFVQRKV